MSTFLKTITLTLLSSLVLVTAQAANDVGEYYGDFMGSVAEPDRDRQLDDGFGGVSLRFGKGVSERWNLEAALDILDLEGDPMFGGRDLNQTAYGLNALAVFNRGGVFQPIIVTGLGIADSQIVGGLSDDNPYYQLGFGAIVPIADDKGRFRTELLYRAEDDKINSKDWILNIGFGLPFGKKAEPVLDGDGDGVPDGSDQCPRTPTGAKVDARGCQLDGDGDGVVDRLDQCPKTPAGARVDARGCELDSDGDGVVDSKDKCPGTPRGTEVDDKGCPVVRIVSLDGVNFRTNEAALTAGATSVLDRQAEKLKNNPDIDIEVAGHTDASGNDDYNMDLSDRRAKTVRDYLVSKGIAADRITSRGYGESDPVASNSTKEGMADNRRVELRIRDRK